MIEAALPVRTHPATLVALVLFTLVSLGLGVVANRVAGKKSGFLPRSTSWVTDRSGPWRSL